MLAYLERERDPVRDCRIGRLAADRDVIDQSLLREPLAASLARLQDQLASALADAQRTGELAHTLDPHALAAATPTNTNAATPTRR